MQWSNELSLKIYLLEFTLFFQFMFSSMAESETKPWSNLLPDLLSLISKKLDVIELLAFRGTCHNWRLASSSATANLKERSVHRAPWLLCQESIDREQCIVHHLYHKRKFRMNLPELVGANFIGSFEGWLFLFNSELGKVFFFCPFTREKICLPDLQQAELCFHSIAVLSSSPTSSDCTICVISRQDDWILDIYILRPGAESWDKVKANSWIHLMGVIDDAVHHKGEFFFFNKGRTKLVKVNIESQAVEVFNLPPRQDAGNSEGRRSYIMIGRYLNVEMVKECLFMDEATKAAPVYVWGTQWHDHLGREVHLLNESNVEQTALYYYSPRHQRRGIWIQPRLFTP